LLTHILFMMNW